MTFGQPNDSGTRLLSLRTLVEEHFDGGTWTEFGLILNATEKIDRHPRLRRSLSFGDIDYTEHVLQMLVDIHRAAPGNLERMEAFVRDRFALGENVSSKVAKGRTVVFQPSVFQIPNEPIETHLISVMMPFDLSLKPVYDDIKFIAADNLFQCFRADDIWEHSTVIQDVFSLIFRSYIVICDFTGRNPNVFYEAGIAHTLGKHVIPITQNPEDVPFDLRHHRYVRYLNNAEGRKALGQELNKRIETLERNRLSS